MNTKKVTSTRLLILTLGAVALSATVHASALAAESASFRLEEGSTTVATPGPDTASSFQLSENGVTWLPFPMAGSHFQIVTGMMASSSSTSSTSSEAAGSISSAPTVTDTPFGSHRGHGTTTGRPAVANRGTKPGKGIPAVRRAVRPRGAAPTQPGDTGMPSLTGVPPHHYRQPVQDDPHAAAPAIESAIRWSHYRQRFLGTLSADLLSKDGSVWTFSIGLLCVLIQGVVLLFIRRRHRRLCCSTRHP